MSKFNPYSAAQRHATEASTLALRLEEVKSENEQLRQHNGLLHAEVERLRARADEVCWGDQPYCFTPTSEGSRVCICVARSVEVERARAQFETAQHVNRQLAAETEDLRHENARLKEANKTGSAQLSKYANQNWDLREERDRLRNLLSVANSKIEGYTIQRDFLKEQYDQADLAVAQLTRRVERLRKAVNWLRGALHEDAHIRDRSPDDSKPTPDECEVWECQRARAVLEEER